MIYSQSLYHTLHFINISWVLVWDNSRTCKNQGECHSMAHNLLYHHITLFSLYEFYHLSFSFKVFNGVISTQSYISWLFSLFFPTGFWGVLLDIHIYIYKISKQISWRNKWRINKVGFDQGGVLQIKRSMWSHQLWASSSWNWHRRADLHTGTWQLPTPVISLCIYMCTWLNQCNTISFSSLFASRLHSNFTKISASRGWISINRLCT
jgi:hypothetical protein